MNNQTLYDAALAHWAGRRSPGKCNHRGLHNSHHRIWMGEYGLLKVDYRYAVPEGDFGEGASFIFAIYPGSNHILIGDQDWGSHCRSLEKCLNFLHPTRFITFDRVKIQNETMRCDSNKEPIVFGTVCDLTTSDNTVLHQTRSVDKRQWVVKPEARTWINGVIRQLRKEITPLIHLGAYQKYSDHGSRQRIETLAAQYTPLPGGPYDNPRKLTSVFRNPGYRAHGEILRALREEIVYWHRNLKLSKPVPESKIEELTEPVRIELLIHTATMRYSYNGGYKTETPKQVMEATLREVRKCLQHSLRVLE